MQDKFSHLIGQESLKRSLRFYAESAKLTGKTPFLLFEGGKGAGKTEFARSFARQIGKPLLEINCGSIKNNRTFFEQVFVPIVMNNEVVVFFDEAHSLPMDLQTTFLTAFNSDAVNSKRVAVGESEVEFDYTKQTYIFATTDSHRLFHALKDRLTAVDFDPYCKADLIAIMKTHAPTVKFNDAVEAIIAETLRGNARSAVKTAKEINSFCLINDKNSFGDSEWRELCFTLGIHPNGLTKSEEQVLQVLNDRGAASLATLAAATNQSRSVLQHGVEKYLLQKGYMIIDGKRHITQLGRNVLADGKRLRN